MFINFLLKYATFSCKVLVTNGLILISLIENNILIRVGEF